MLPSAGAPGAAAGFVVGALWRAGVGGPPPVGVPSDPVIIEG